MAWAKGVDGVDDDKGGWSAIGHGVAVVVVEVELGVMVEGMVS